ncbi:MAG: hypothetical protein ACK5N8_01540 [Alphaproteobacteria bacterium]
MLSKKEHKNNIKNFRNNLKNEVEKLRVERGLSVEDIVEQSHIPLLELFRLEQKRDYNWGTIYQLARFFDKKIRITFY